MGKKKQTRCITMDIVLKRGTPPQEEPPGGSQDVSQKVAVLSWEVRAPWVLLPLEPFSGTGVEGEGSNTDIWTLGGPGLTRTFVSFLRFKKLKNKILKIEKSL